MANVSISISLGTAQAPLLASGHIVNLGSGLTAIPKFAVNDNFPTPLPPAIQRGNYRYVFSVAVQGGTFTLIANDENSDSQICAHFYNLAFGNQLPPFDFQVP